MNFYKKMRELPLEFRSCFDFIENFYMPKTVANRVKGDALKVNQNSFYYPCFFVFVLFHNQISETLCGKDFQFALAVAADIVGLHAI